jgi:hypothetical protein
MTYPTQLAISSGTYVSGTGLITLTLPSTPGITAPGGTVYLGGLTGTGAFASLNSSNSQVETVNTGTGPSGTTLVVQGPIGAGAATISGGDFGYANNSQTDGWTENNCQYLSEVSKEQAIVFLLTGVKQYGGSVTNCHFSGDMFGDLAIEPSPDNPGTVATGNIFEGFEQNAVAPGNVSNLTFSNNFSFNVNSQQGIPYPGDYFIIGTQVYEWVTGTPTAQGQIQIDPGGSEAQTIMNAACAVAGATAIVPWATSPGEGGHSGTFDCNPADGHSPPVGANYAPTYSGETADANVSVGWYYLSPNYSLDFTALTTGTGPNTLQFLNGSTAMGTCFSIPVGVTTNCANPIASGRANFIAVGGPSTSGANVFGCGNSAGQAACTTANPAFAIVAGSSGVAAQNALQFIGDHTDQLILIVNSTPYPAIPMPNASGGYPPGTFNNNICVENQVVSNATVAAARCLFLQDNTNYGLPSPTATGNIAFAMSSDTLQFQNSANASVCCNTVLLDSLSPIWSPGSSTFDVYSNDTWWQAVGSFSPLVIQILNAAYLPSATTSGGSFTYNLSSRTAFQTFSPTMSAPTQLANETLSNSIGSSTPNGSGLYTNTYLPVFPSLPNTATNTNPFPNRAAAITAFTPTQGTLFNATTVNTSTSLTVNSGWIPVVGIPVNDTPTGACIPAGDIVASVSGSTYPYTATLEVAATCAHTSTFGTMVLNGDGTENGALTPDDSSGHACWNVAGVVFNPSETCAAQGLTPALPIPTGLGLIFNNSANSGLIPATGGF